MEIYQTKLAMYRNVIKSLQNSINDNIYYDCVVIITYQLV